MKLNNKRTILVGLAFLTKLLQALLGWRLPPQMAFGTPTGYAFSGGITGEILHLDGGYNVMGSPGRLLDAAKDMGAK